MKRCFGGASRGFTEGDCWAGEAGREETGLVIDFDRW